MSSDVEHYIRQNVPWAKVPAIVKSQMANSVHEWEKAVLNYSIRNQLRWRSNIVRQVVKNEKKYYEEIVRYSLQNLMLYPYHLADILVKGLRITPFGFYSTMMFELMNSEKSYDSLPNFTAVDCLRLLGIGRNQYIDMMNQSKSKGWKWGKLGSKFKKAQIKELLPSKPVNVNIEYWWTATVGYVTEDDIARCSTLEHQIIDLLIDNGPTPCYRLNKKKLCELYSKGLVYLNVPIEDNDKISVPPLEGFVMNRVLGDYFEKLLYKIFVSMDEQSTVAELANILQIDLQLVKDAVSMYCRLGFAKKKTHGLQNMSSKSGKGTPGSTTAAGSTDVLDAIESGESSCSNSVSTSTNSICGSDVDDNIAFAGDARRQCDMESVHRSWLSQISLLQTNPSASPPKPKAEQGVDNMVKGLVDMEGKSQKRIAFMFDSTLTAYLMMGNLSPGLKNHAVTMFEVGKLPDESMDSFLTELGKVDVEAEGEAQTYFDHAVTLRDTLLFFRNTEGIFPGLNGDIGTSKQPIDLIRFESLNSLDSATCSRVLNKNYQALISMAPLSNEVKSISSCLPFHIGPPLSEANSAWFKLWLYCATGSGPASVLLSMGHRIKKLPKVFRGAEKLLMTTWHHDSTAINCHSMLSTVNEALCQSPVLIQEYTFCSQEPEMIHVPFPFDDEVDLIPENGTIQNFTEENMYCHPVVRKLRNLLHLQHSFGYITMMKRECLSNVGDDWNSNDGSKEWVLFNVSFGMPLFSKTMNKKICQRIQKFKIFETKNLQKHVSFTRKLSLELLDFIMVFQDIHVDSSVVNSSKRSIFNLVYNGDVCDSFNILHPDPVAELRIQASDLKKSADNLAASRGSSRESMLADTSRASEGGEVGKAQNSIKKNSKTKSTSTSYFMATLSKFVAHPTVNLIFEGSDLKVYSEYDYDYCNVGREDPVRSLNSSDCYNDAGFYCR
eukprot:Nk52_evm33s1360 gene=Nk52_evmTU33s1360